MELDRQCERVTVCPSWSEFQKNRYHNSEILPFQTSYEERDAIFNEVGPECQRNAEKEEQRERKMFQFGKVVQSMRKQIRLNTQYG